MAMMGTTICAVKRGNQIAVAGDGQVTMGEHTIFKSTAKKVRRIPAHIVIAVAGGGRKMAGRYLMRAHHVQHLFRIMIFDRFHAAEGFLTAGFRLQNQFSGFHGKCLFSALRNAHICQNPSIIRRSSSSAEGPASAQRMASSALNHVSCRLA